MKKPTERRFRTTAVLLAAAVFLSAVSTAGTAGAGETPRMGRIHLVELSRPQGAEDPMEGHGGAGPVQEELAAHKAAGWTARVLFEEDSSRIPPCPGQDGMKDGTDGAGGVGPCLMERPASSGAKLPASGRMHFLWTGGKDGVEVPVPEAAGWGGRTDLRKPEEPSWRLGPTVGRLWAWKD